jgi:hypothetical protein
MSVKTIGSFLSGTLPFALLLFVSLACNMGKSSESGTVQSTTTDDIAGTYDITGTNENGAGSYMGGLVVTNRGDVYQFSWDTAGKKYDGVGVRTDKKVGVAFASGDSGEGCGVVLYKIGSNATLEGRAGYWGNDRIETETARRIGGTNLNGDYEVLGKNTDGNEYVSRLTVRPSGAGYTFSWSSGSSFKGFGIKQDDYIAVGFGGDNCGFVIYDIGPNGTLDGKWGGYGSTAVGTELATRKK